MTTVYPQTAVGQASPARQLPPRPGRPTVMELPPATMTWLNQTATTLVNQVMRRTWMTPSERQMFREDLLQEAFSALYEVRVRQGRSAAYAYTAARTRLIGYVFVNIRGGGRGHQWELSKQYQIADNLTEPEYHEEDGSGQLTPRLPMAVYARRPTEDDLVHREGQAAAADRWVQFEQEIVRILAVMRGQQWHPHSLCRAARALAESARGTSNYNIARLLGIDWLTATQIILHYRQQLAAFLALSPLHQGLIRAEGTLRLQWWEEVTTATLNRGQRFIVIMPHGAFTVSYYHHKGKGKHLCRMQLGRRINGRLHNRSAQLGEVGQLTRDTLWQKSLVLQAKIAALVAADDAIAVPAAVAH